MKLTYKDLKVLSFDEAKASKEKFDYVLSIADPKSNHHHDVCLVDSYKIKFHDVDEYTEGYREPNRFDVENIKTFLQKFLQDDSAKSLMVHCYAGISRSSASALYALMLDGYDIDTAMDTLLTVRPIAMPNLLMVQYMDRDLGLNDKLLEAVYKSHEMYPLISGVKPEGIF